jgi:hypothetical protein
MNMAYFSWSGCYNEYSHRKGYLMELVHATLIGERCDSHWHTASGMYACNCRFASELRCLNAGTTKSTTRVGAMIRRAGTKVF